MGARSRAPPVPPRVPGSKMGPRPGNEGRQTLMTQPPAALAPIAALLLAAAPALAHHPLDGAPMATFGHGLLSGVGHPVLGFDHLLFVAAAGVAAALAGARRAGAGAYVAAMLAGCALAAGGLGLPAVEAVVALSLLAVGGLVASGRRAGRAGTPLLLAGFGLFHGAAFGAAMAGVEAGAGGPVLAGYLLGLGAVQLALALGSGWLALRLWGREAQAPGARVAGAMAAGAGLLLTLETLEGAAFAALGLG